MPLATLVGRGMATCILTLATLALADSGRLQAQTATVAVEENFRAEPNGTLLGRINPGTVLDVESVEGDWVRATLEGWIWTPSVAQTDRTDLDLVVSVEGGESLRVEPQETVLARLEDGTLLEEVERGDGWIRVRRTGWIWLPSVEVVRAPSSTSSDDGAAPTFSRSAVEETLATSGAGGLAILATPDGDTLARSLPGSDLRILGRQGNWARVQLEGWAWLPEGVEAGGDGESTLVEVDPDAVADDPDTYRGATVAWELRFISLEEAEPVRTDFYEGEPYLLTRWAGSSSRFVYVAVPPERLEAVESLTPLERILVVGRIRTGSAALTGGPILDLMEISRESRGGNGGR